MGLRKLYAQDPYNWDLIGVPRAKTFNKWEKGIPMGVVFEAAFTLCDFRMPKRIIRLLERLKPKDLSSLSSYLNTYTKNALSKIYPVQDWIKLVDWGGLVGYPSVKDRTYKDDVAKWLIKPGLAMELKDSYLDRLIDRVLGEVVNKPWPKFTDWLYKRWTWVTDGASKYSTIEVEGERMKTKLGAALSLSDKELYQAVSKEAIMRDGLRAFVKPDEPGIKGRYIINAPFGLFVKWKYILDYLIACTPLKSPLLAQFRTAQERILTIMTSIASGVQHIPVDVESFDYNIHKRLWDVLHRYLKRKLPDTMQWLVLELSEYVGTLPVFDQNGKLIGVWKKGMPSGLFITMFMDSVWNLMAQFHVAEVLPDIIPGFAQGDDGDLEEEKDVDMELVKDAYLDIGMFVHPGKNWKTQGVTEFLKTIITKSEVFQYPMRAIRSLLWAFPDFRNNTIAAKLQTLAVVWKEVIDRVGYSKFLYDSMIKDIHAGVLDKLKWSQQKVKLWLHGLPALGGFGLVPVQFDYYFKIDSKRERMQVKGLRFRNYPLLKEIVTGIRMIRVDKRRLLYLSKVKTYSMFDIFGEWPTWPQYIQYLRYTAGLSSTIDRPLPNKDSIDKTPFRYFGWSDIYTKHVLGEVLFKGLTVELHKIYQNWHMLLVNPEIFGRQLWK